MESENCKLKIEIAGAKSMSLTIKEIADQLNVSKTAVRKHMDDKFRDTYTEKNGNKILITDSGVEELKKQFANSKSVESDDGDNAKSEKKTDTASGSSKSTSKQAKKQSNVPAVNVEEYELLSEQLDEQVKQLKAKDKQIAELHQLLDQSQRLQLDVQNKLKQLESKTDQSKSIEGSSNDNIPNGYRPAGSQSRSTAYNAAGEEKRHWWQLWK